MSNIWNDSERARLADSRQWTKIYWDSCAWLGKLNAEPHKVAQCDYWLARAKNGDHEIYTSSITLAEVFKVSCSGVLQGVSPADDQAFQDLIEQPWVLEVQCDHQVGKKARELLRAHTQLKKPTDAIHLATALLNNCDVMFTFDHRNLIVLSGTVFRSDGHPLEIMEPPDALAGTLFAIADSGTT